MSWGKGIILAYVVFATFIGTLVTICVREDISLVSGSYYKDELNYQDQMIRVRNTSELKTLPVIQAVGNTVEVRFDRLNEIQNGKLQLFCPSNEARDRNFEVQPSSRNLVSFDLPEGSQGKFVAKFSWSMDGKDYYQEETIFI